MTRTIRAAVLLLPLLTACATPRPVPRPPGSLRLSVCDYGWSILDAANPYLRCFSGSYKFPDLYGGGGGSQSFGQCFTDDKPVNSQCVTVVFKDLAAGSWAVDFKHGDSGRKVQNVCYSLDIPPGGQADAVMFWRQGGPEAGSRPVGLCRQR